MLTVPEIRERLQRALPALRAMWAMRVREHGVALLVVLAPIAWAFRGVFRGQTYAQSWWYAYDPVFAAARHFQTPERAATIWDPSPSALNSVADRFSAESLANFELPLWNPYQALGMPLLGEVHPVVLSPLRLLCSFPFGGGDFGTTLLMITQLSLAGVGAYFWLRACDRSREAAAVAGAAYPFVGGAIGALHFTTTAGVTSLPWMLLTGENFVRVPTMKNAARFSLAAAFAAYVTHPSVAFVCGMGAALYVVVRSFQKGEQTLTVLGKSVIAGVMTASVAALILLPFLELMRNGWTYKQVLEAGVAPTDIFTHFLFPPIASVTYFPAVIVLLSIAGLFLPSRTKWACAVMFYVALGLCFEIPGSRILAHIPFQEVFGRAYIILVACAGIVGLFANAIDLLAKHTKPLRWSPLAILLVIGGSIFLVHHEHAWPASFAMSTLEGSRVLAGVLALVVGVLLALVPSARRRLLPPLLYACIFLEVFQRTPHHIRPEPTFDFPATSARDFLTSRLRGAERIIATGTWASYTDLTPHVPNVGLVTHLHDIRSADPLYVERTHALLDPMSARSWYAIHFWSYPEPRGQNGNPERLPTLMEMLGVRYALSRPGAAPPLHHREVYRDETLVVYENPRAFPRAFIVHEAVHANHFEQALGVIANTDLRTTAVIDTVPLPDLEARIEGSRESVRLTHFAPRHITIEADLASTGLVLFSDAYYPGWYATLDDEPIEILPANVAIRALRVPRGHHRIEFHYTPMSARVGGWSAALGLLLAVWLATRRTKWHASSSHV